MAGHLMLDGLDWDFLRNLFNYLVVVRHCYGVHLPFEKSILVQNVDRETGFFKTFQMRAQFDMLRVRPRGDLPTIDLEAVRNLGQQMTSLEAWRRLIPASEFEFYGMVVYEATDVSEESNRSQLKETLVKPEPFVNDASFDEIQSLLRSLLRIPDLNLSVIGIQGEQAFSIDSTTGFRHDAEEAKLGTFIC